MLDSEIKLTLVDSPNEAVQTKDNRCLAIFCINLFSVSIVMTSVIFKQLKHAGVTVLDYQFYRIFTIFVLSAIVVSCRQQNPFGKIPQGRQCTMLLLIIFALTAVFIFYAALAMAPLTIINVIIKLDSFIVLVLGYCINNEKINPSIVVSMIICFASILAMTLSAKKETNEEGEDSDKQDTKLTGIGMALIVAFFGGSMPILTRRLKDMPASSMMFLMGLFGTLIMGILIVLEAYWINAETYHIFSYTPWQLFLIITSSVFSAIATISYTIAYQSDTAGFIVLIGNVKIIYFFLSDTFIFNEIFSSVELISVICITTVVVIVAVQKTLEKNR